MPKKLETEIRRHKSCGNWFLQKEGTNEGALVAYIQSGREVSLVMSGFKCQKCGDKERITFHHLISRIAKRYINDNKRYLMQRNYWGNIIILCDRCHRSIHEETPENHNENNRNNFISKIFIVRMRKKYGMLEAKG